MLKRLALALAAGLVALAAPAVPLPAAAASGCATVQPPVGPAFADCAGGSAYNILPPGSDGLVNAAEVAAPPPHQQDQRPMYANLVYAAPNLQAAQLGQFYKTAALGVAASDVDRIDRPRPGVEIVWDKSFGVPHVFGATRADTEFGAGYAAARDRLFLMDILRHVGRSEMSAFLGPSQSDLAMDCMMASYAGYNEAELQQQIDRLPKELTAPFGNGNSEGQQIVADGTAYADGVNAYIKAALADPRLMPAEYPALQEAPAPWAPTDIVAVAAIVQAIFATGGGGEVASALLYQSLVATYGQAKGSAIWHDLRSQNDPEAPTTLQATFPYEQVGSVNPAAVAMPTQDPSTDFCDGGPVPPLNAGVGKVSVGPVSVDLSSLFGPPHMSNALVVGAGDSASGHPIAVFGPQTGYFAPEILHEVDLHGPGLSARGVAFPGTDIYVELGRGADYSWSATSAGSDLVDQRLERLCNLDGTPATTKSTAYVFDGKCTPMYERTDREVAKTSPGGPNPPQVITIQIERTVHGPVVGRTYAPDPASGRPVPVAVSIQRSTWFDELGAAAAFLEWNNPQFMHGAKDFLRAAAKETGTFNWFYADSRDIAYYSSGKLPVRAAGTDPNFPAWGTGQWEWQGFLRADGSAQDPHPHAVDPPQGWMTNWNNKPAPGWSAADSNYAYGPVYRVQSLSDRIRAALGKGKLQPVDVVNAMEDGGTVDLDGSQLVSQLQAALNGAALSPQQSEALGILAGWYSAGAHRRATAADRSQYVQGGAVAIMDALYPRLTHAVFDPWLSSDQYRRLAGIMAVNNPPGPVGSAYDGGWEGYLQRSLRQAVNPAIADPYSQSYCGSGSLAACQKALIAALQGALDQLSAAYGNPDPASWTCSRSNQGGGQCNPARDDIVFSAAGVEQVPNMPWVNRPTFQQVVSYPAAR